MSITLSTLKSLRNDASFERFWQTTCSSCELDVGSPDLRQCRRACLVEGSAPTFSRAVEEHYRIIYFVSDQPCYKSYRQVQALQRLQLHNHMKNWVLFSHSVALTLMLYFLQHSWKYFLKIFNLMARLQCVMFCVSFAVVPRVK